MPIYRYIFEMNEAFEVPEGLSDEEVEKLAYEHARQAITNYGICPWQES